jgi:DnaJ-class molecular chaperone
MSPLGPACIDGEPSREEQLAGVFGPAICPDCAGTGKDGWYAHTGEPCSSCGGTGQRAPVSMLDADEPPSCLAGGVTTRADFAEAMGWTLEEVDEIDRILAGVGSEP